MPILKLQPHWNLGGDDLPQTKIYTLPSGELGNIATVQFLIKLARKRSKHPVLRQLAVNIIRDRDTKSMNYADEVKAIGQWVKDTVPYVRDIANVETVHDPLTMIDKIQRDDFRGDCDDLALLTATLLLTIGHRPVYRIVKYRKDSPSYNHIYVVVYTKNKGQMPERIVLDTILKSKPIGFEVPHAEGKEFPV